MVRLAFIPTMGYLHEGHLSLVRRARQECDRVVVSIFVNPIQFEPQEDFSNYPRNFERDRRLLAAEGVDEIWFPTVEEIYPEGIERVLPIEPPVHLTQILCGKDRPHHFSGVATVVKRLLECVQPTDVYFGQKDYQQTRVIDWLIQSYFFQLRMHVLPTVREVDGLAMSSRNVYLSAEERRVAPLIFQGLQRVAVLFEQGERRVSHLLKGFDSLRTHSMFSILYAEIRDADSLVSIEVVGGSAVVAVAVKLGKTRLIDNLCLQNN